MDERELENLLEKEENSKKKHELENEKENNENYEITEEKDKKIEEEVSTPEEMAEEIQKINSEEELEEYLDEKHSVDVAESFEELDDEELLRVFELMTDEQKASIIEQADEELQERIISLFSMYDDLGDKLKSVIENDFRHCPVCDKSMSWKDKNKTSSKDCAKISLVENQEKTNLDNEVAALREFKLNAERQSKQQMIDSFYMLSDEDKKDVAEHIDTYSLDDIEAKLSILCVRNKVNFNLEEKHKDEDNTPKGLFKLNNPETDNVPDWVKAIRETAKSSI